MFRRILLNVFIFLCLFIGQLPVFAQSFEKLYGDELLAVPYHIRVQYMKRAGKPWAKATYQERERFLMEDYRRQMREEIARQKRQVSKQKIEMNKDINRQRSKQEELRKQQDKERRKMEEENYLLKKKRERDRKKFFQQNKLQEMKKKARPR